MRSTVIPSFLLSSADPDLGHLGRLLDGCGAKKKQQQHKNKQTHYL